MGETFGIDSNDYLNLIWNLTWTFDPLVTTDTGEKMHMTDVVTEMGFCYTFNSKIASYFSYS